MPTPRGQPAKPQGECQAPAASQGSFYFAPHSRCLCSTAGTPPASGGRQDSKMGPKIPEPWLFKQTLSEVFLCQDFADEIKVPKQLHLKYRNN